MAFDTTVSGGLGDDVLLGTDGANLIYGNEGNDKVTAKAGNDLIYGWTGSDTIYGDDGDDTLAGDADGDWLSGGAGKDVFYAGDGNDTLTGGTGFDIMNGGAGTNTYLFRTLADSSRLETTSTAAAGGDFVTTFVNGVDKFDVSALGVTGFASSAATATNGQIFASFDASLYRTLVNIKGTDFQFYMEGNRTAELDSSDFITKAGVTHLPPDENVKEKLVFAPMLGQSNASKLYYYDGNSKSGMSEFSTTFKNMTGVNAVGVFYDAVGQVENPCMGGSSIDGDRATVDDAHIWWYPNSHTPGGALLRAVAMLKENYQELAVRGEVMKTTVLWCQGENNAWEAGVSSDPVGNALRYKQATSETFDYIKAALKGDVEFYIMQTPLPVVAAGLAAGYSQTTMNQMLNGGKLIQQMQAELAAERADVYMSAQVNDLPSAYSSGDPASATDIWHLTSDSYDLLGSRLGASVAEDFLHDFPITPPDAKGQLFVGTAVSDTITGTVAADTIIGGGGKDILTGKGGADVFRYSAISDSQDDNAANDNRYDTIMDFTHGVDKIDVRALGFHALDTDGGRTEAQELRFTYSATTDRTYIRNDQDAFAVAIAGDYRGKLDDNDFIFNPTTVTITGGAAAESVQGQSKGELLLGLGGDDKLYGRAGTDILDGGAGKDVLYGGADADIFRFTSLSDSVHTSSKFDRIADFQDGVDKIDVTGLGFTALDTDGGRTEAGELRLVYSAGSNRTFVRCDQHDFEFYLDGNHTTTLTDADFIYS